MKQIGLCLPVKGTINPSMEAIKEQTPHKWKIIRNCWEVVAWISSPKEDNAVNVQKEDDGWWVSVTKDEVEVESYNYSDRGNAIRRAIRIINSKKLSRGNK